MQMFNRSLMEYLKKIWGTKSNINEIYSFLKNENLYEISKFTIDEFLAYWITSAYLMSIIFDNDNFDVVSEEPEKIIHYVVPLWFLLILTKQLGDFDKVIENPMFDDINNFIERAVDIAGKAYIWKDHPQELKYVFSPKRWNEVGIFDIKKTYNINDEYSEFCAIAFNLYERIFKAIKTDKIIKSSKIKDNSSKQNEDRQNKHNRKNIARGLKRKIFKIDKYTCVYCGVRILPHWEVADEEQKDYPDLGSIDHMDPFNNKEFNLVTSCRSCNSRKGQSTPEQSRMIPIYGRFIKIKYQDYINQFMEKAE